MVMLYPSIKIDLEKIRHNVKTVVKLCRDNDIEVAGVTKVFGGDIEIAQAYVEGGVSYLADSRIENLIRMKSLKVPKIMLRLPMISEAAEVVRHSDISFNSEITTIKKLSDEAVKLGKRHKIVLMVDLGDLREGFMEEESLYKAVEEIKEFSGVEILGLATNLTCYGGVIPSKNILDRLVCLGRNIEERYHTKLQMISGGNSSTIHLLKDHQLYGINHLRLGESLILGTESAYGLQIEGTSNEAFILNAEIIEIKEKPSIPIGEVGKDAFGKVPHFIDRGIRRRIICGIGKQDVDFESLHPMDEDLIILGGSSDHLILDGSDSKIDYKIGDPIDFKMGYVSILRAMTSEYVKKKILP